ncbi:SDR family NAD(P)-dependent oxidoreductase [Ktedonospora formicarum]|uniref:Putative dehydrogenase/reductase n=1 Tax=Ktedonospora formicarum TaxID=2778364 RepID=A0A8J3I441_9CHLR|nr:SDR family NAD(P)-dependent oxidoreductase [Ktedonospora formicarum]GHO47191.1 putative dehydrogenase/reductase [Ktedonospora formicarum]
MSSPKHIIVMTGATSGIGAEAVKQLAAEPATLVLIGARGQGRSAPGAEVFPLDLASLSSVRAFADAIQQRLGEANIEMLVLNAGGQFPGGKLSGDGFEMTFATNHLAHYLLARLLLPNMAVGGRLVLTTSDTHDPAVFPFAPRTLDPEELAHPSKAGSGGARAYAASKLCNLLTARSFAALDTVKANTIQVIAYNPGLTLGTGLGRTDAQRQSSPQRPNPLAHAIFGLLGRFNNAWSPGTPERAGEVLAQLTLGIITPPPGRVYASLVKGEITFPDPSELARSDEARDRLWRESASMVGLPVEATSVR